MKEINFELCDGKFCIICRFNDFDNTWTAVLLNTITFKVSKLFHGNRENLSILVTILFELDKKHLL
jgi:hypothetical protein